MESREIYDETPVECEDCGAIGPYCEAVGVINLGSLCPWCYAQYEIVVMAPDKNLTPELWY